MLRAVHHPETRQEPSGIISHWSTDTLTRLVEKYVGRDLQFVRLNGTLVGGLVGLVLFTLNAIVTSSL
jgi:uncharacterized membrane-anchored protein YjiN (DUF445 family)